MRLGCAHSQEDQQRTHLIRLKVGEQAAIELRLEGTEKGEVEMRHFGREAFETGTPAALFLLAGRPSQCRL